MDSPSLPLVISCQGGTSPAGLAADVAAALEHLGVAEVVRDPDRVVAAGRAGRRVIALDGCASACRARLLAAKHLRPQVAINLTELDVGAQNLDEVDPLWLAAETATLLRSRTATRQQTRAPRPAPPALTARTKRAHVVDDYLLAIDALASTTVECGALAADAPTLAAHVSRVLAVSRASAGEMLGRLEAAGLVERGEHRELALTARGRAAADRAVRRHRLIECFVSDFLGYPFAECYERARLLGGGFDDDAIEHARLALGDPVRCPHGWPISPQLAREESRELIALPALAEHEEATVVCVAEHNDPHLAHPFELGLTPGTQLSVGHRPLGAGGVAVHICGTTRRMETAVAAEVFVRRR